MGKHRRGPGMAITLAVAGLTGLVGPTGCGPEASSRGDPDDPGAADTVEVGIVPRGPEGAARTAAGAGLAVRLVEKHDSDVTATALLRVAPGDSVRVELRAAGLVAERRYAAHVHEGSCTAGGPVTVRLGFLEPGEAGSAVRTAIVPRAGVFGPGSRYLQIHAPDGIPVACGELPGAIPGEVGAGAAAPGTGDASGTGETPGSR